MINIKFDDLLKAVDSLSPEQKRLLRERIDVNWSAKFSKALDDLQADLPTNLSDDEIQADIEAAIRDIRSSKS